MLLIRTMSMSGQCVEKIEKRVYATTRHDVTIQLPTEHDAIPTKPLAERITLDPPPSPPIQTLILVNESQSTPLPPSPPPNLRFAVKESQLTPPPPPDPLPFCDISHDPSFSRP